MTRLKQLDRRALGLSAAWIVAAGTLGGAWAVKQAQNGLASDADSHSVVQDAQDAGASIEWHGRTAYLDPSGLSTSESGKVLDRLRNLDGAHSAHLLTGTSDSESSLPVTTTSPTTTTLASTTSPTTVKPATTQVTTTSLKSDSSDSTEPQTTTTEATPDLVGASALEAMLRGRTIEFVGSTAIPTPATQPLLGELRQLLAEYPELRLHLVGHTDVEGNQAANQTLSEARAQSVANHMILRGVDADRMTVEGRGSSEPLSTDQSEAGKQTNRRVVIEAART